MGRSIRLSAPWRSCLGYRHVGCLQLSHRRPPEMCGLWTRPRTDVDPPRFLPASNCYRRGHIVSPPPGRYLDLVEKAGICWCHSLHYSLLQTPANPHRVNTCTSVCSSKTVFSLCDRSFVQAQYLDLGYTNETTRHMVRSIVKSLVQRCP